MPPEIRLIIRLLQKTTEREMDKTLIAVVSGILEGLLICSGILTQNAFVLVVAAVFFAIQWRHLEK